MNRTAVPEQETLEWVALAQQGDRQAFGELVYHYREGVINVVYRMCGDANLAEDAAQEAFIRAWQHLPRYQPRSSFRNWLYRIALNVALDVLRRERETVDVENIPLIAASLSPEAAIERSERAAYVQQAVLGLSPASRAALILREYEGLSYKEIAEMLEIPVGTVMSRLNYARTQLRETLRGYLEAG
ncbi:MAG: RNA polymerase sigma factor [Anaerolineae bacterium]